MCTRRDNFSFLLVVGIVGVTILGIGSRTSAQTEIVNLAFSPVSRTVEVGDQFEFGLLAKSGTGVNIPMSGVGAVLNWDPAKLLLIGVNNNGPYSWLVAGLPTGPPYPLNTSLTDGNAYFEASSRFPPLPIATATPAGLLVTSFVFRALATTSGPTLISMPVSQGTNYTMVVSYTQPGVDILGTRGTAGVTITVDCNNNGIPDATDIAQGTSLDCNGNTIPDKCEIAVGSTAPGGPFFCTTACDPDCNNNGIPDSCDPDCDGDDIPNTCEPDTDGDGVPNDCDVCPGFPDAVDTDGDGVPNGCDICPGGNDNVDGDGDGIPNFCDACPQDNPNDSDGDGVCNSVDACPGFNDNLDTDGDGVPNGCDICAFGPDNVDCQPNGVPDACDIHAGTSLDCQPNGVPDSCDISSGSSTDINVNNIPDDCEPPPPCYAHRNLADPRPSYCPGTNKRVHILLDNIPPGTLAVALESMPPAGWTTVSNISNGGAWDAVNKKVKWGPFFVDAGLPFEVTYDVFAPLSATGVKNFFGIISVDGINTLICGDASIDENCSPRVPADEDQPACLGCTDCSDSASCEDGLITLNEVTGYACAWKRGCNDNLAAMTRAAFIWKSTVGACYCWDDGIANWNPAACPAPITGLCAGAPAPSFAGDLRGAANFAVADVTGRAIRRARGADRGLVIPITINASPEVSVVALDFEVPAGWLVSGISDGGVWDPVNRKVKWGPFFSGHSRTVSFKAFNRSRGADLSGFGGTISFDGENQEIEAR